MSPTASEVVPNKPLVSTELRELMLRDFEKLLDGWSLLNSIASFGRLSWQIKVTLVTEQSTQESVIESRQHPVNMIIGEGRLARSVPAPEQYRNVEAHPLKSALARAASRTLTHAVTSPNAERLREGLEVPVDVRQSDGQTRQQNIKYA